jgi:hypothetical protein
MKEVIVFFVVVVLSFFVAKDYGQCNQFVETMGGSSSERAYFGIETSEGAIVVTGYTYSFGAGGKDLLLAEFDSCGDTLWIKTLEGRGMVVTYAKPKGYEFRERLLNFVT